MSNPKPIELHKTCEACPAQWEGMTSKGSHLYIRYRYGWLTCDVSNIQIFKDKMGDDLHGYMTDSEMQEALSDVLDFGEFEFGLSN